MKKVTFLSIALILFIGMFFIVQSCQKEIIEKQPTDSEYKVTHKSLSEINGIKSLERPLNILKPWLENFRNKNTSFGISFAIDPDNIIETLTDSISTYSFKILTPTDPLSLYETFVVDNSDKKNIRYHIYKYQIKQDENHYSYLKLNRLDISEFNVKIGNFSKDINKITVPSIDELEDGCYVLGYNIRDCLVLFECGATWIPVDCNSFGSGGSTDNSGTTSDDASGSDGTFYVAGDIDSSEQTNVGGSGGGSGETTGGSGDSTTSNPFTFNSDISPIMLSKIVALSNTISEIDSDFWIENDINIWATKVAENLTITEVVLLQNFLSENKTPEAVIAVSHAISDFTTFSINNYPGISDGFPYEWWNDNNFVEQLFNQNPYDVWNRITNAERQLIKNFPNAAYHIYKNKSIAENATNLKFGNNGLNDKSDAFRHAYYNAINSKIIGRYMASLFSTAHESEVPSGLVLEKNMDLFNNNVGHNSVYNYPQLTVNQLIEQVYQEVLNGNLVYLYPIDFISSGYYDGNGDGMQDCFTCFNGITILTEITPTNLP